MDVDAKGYDLGNGYRVVLTNSRLGQLSMLFKGGVPMWAGETSALKRAIALIARDKLN